MYDLSILIVHFETPDLLDELLGRLGGSGAEIIVVDNASLAPRTDEVLGRWANRTHIIRNSQNEGFAVASNLAFRASRGRYVMSLNPDAQVAPKSLEVAVSYLDEHPEVGLLGPDSTIRRLPKWYRPGIVQRFRPFGQPWLAEPTESDWIIGTGLVCRRSVLRRDYLFDESLFLFGEELELGCYVAQLGFSLIVHPDFHVIHRIGASYDREDHEVIDRLRSAALWRGRRDYYGRTSAIAFELTEMIDASVLLVGAVVRRSDSRRGYVARVHTAFGLLTQGDRFVRRANAAARTALARTRAAP